MKNDKLKIVCTMGDGTGKFGSLAENLLPVSISPSSLKESGQASGSLLDCNYRISNQLTQPGHFLAHAS